MNLRLGIMVVCVMAFLAITIHHLIVCGRLFDLSDMLHHEFFSFLFLAFGGGLGASYFLEDN